MRKLSDNLIKEWDFEKNTQLSPNYIKNINIKVWWQCINNCSHKWEAIIGNRIKGTGCPFCSKRKVSEANSLAKHQNIINQWNYEKNNSLNPDKISEFSSKKVWWKCDKDHEWEAVVAARTSQKQNCPFCANKRPCQDNCLETKYPELSKKWDIIKNDGLMPKDVLPHSKKKIWWICLKGHSFITWLSDMINGKTTCTQCLGYTIRDRKMINTNDGYRICKICLKELNLIDFRIKNDKRDNKKRLDNICKPCSAANNSEYWRTDKGISAHIVVRTKYFCKKNKLPFDLDKKWVLDKLNNINWKCELTGLPMKKNAKGGFVLDSISVDRIKPGQGYTKDNIRFVLNQVNIFRQNGDDNNMYKIAQALLDYRGKL